jgi:DNA polymerase III epsilon subunit-like protein
MVVSRVPNPQSTLYFYDCEVNHKDIETVDITELCVSENNPPKSSESSSGSSSSAAVSLSGPETKPYFVGYAKKPQGAVNPGSFLKPIPAEYERHKLVTILRNLVEYVDLTSAANSVVSFMGYNVLGWDQPVLQNNMDRTTLPVVLKNKILQWKWVDLAKIAQSLGYPKGTTQQQLEMGVGAMNLPFNRHRARADVKVVKEIWRKLTGAIEGNLSAQIALDAAFAKSDPEEEVAGILKFYESATDVSEEIKELIERTKVDELLQRKEIIVLYDLESTGLFPEAKRETAASFNLAPRIVEFAAKILSPFEGPEYENESFQSLVNPHTLIPEGATLVHGIRSSEVLGSEEEGILPAPEMKQVWSDFTTWVKASNTFRRIRERCGGVEPRIVLVGYNNSNYDTPLLTGELLKGGVDLKRQIDKGVCASMDMYHLMSTLYTGLPKDKKPEDNKMQTHAKFLGVEEEGAHRALADVDTLQRVLEKVAGSNSSMAQVLAQMVEQSAQYKNPGKTLKAAINYSKAGASSITAVSQAVEDIQRENERAPVKKRRVEEDVTDSQEVGVTAFTSDTQSQEYDGLYTVI